MSEHGVYILGYSIASCILVRPTRDHGDLCTCIEAKLDGVVIGFQSGNPRIVVWLAWLINSLLDGVIEFFLSVLPFLMANSIPFFLHFCTLCPLRAMLSVCHWLGICRI